jgi:ABC-type lipoprotein export system ATPase subunit
MLQVSDIEFGYAPSAPRFRFPDFTCGAGEHWLMLGQSGCGKTTLLHLIAGLLKPTRGRVNILGTDTTRLSGAAADHFRGRHVGIVFQQNHLMRALNVEENVLAAQYFAGAKQDRKRVRELLGALGLDEHGHKLPRQLSQGQQQRVAIARALVNRPALILADEPTSSLDDTNTDQVIGLLERTAGQEGAALLIVTHDNRLKNRFSKRIELATTS